MPTFQPIPQSRCEQIISQQEPSPDELHKLVRDSSIDPTKWERNASVASFGPAERAESFGPAERTSSVTSFGPAESVASFGPAEKLIDVLSKEGVMVKLPLSAYLKLCASHLQTQLSTIASRFVAVRF